MSLFKKLLKMGLLGVVLYITYILAGLLSGFVLIGIALVVPLAVLGALGVTIITLIIYFLSLGGVGFFLLRRVM